MATYTTREAAEFLHLSRNSVTAYAQRGILNARKQGRDYVIEQAEIERYNRERKKPGGQPGHPNTRKKREQL